MPGLGASAGEAADSQLSNLKSYSISCESFKKITLLLSLGLVDFRAQGNQKDL